jgi:hypothetical protein
MKEKSLSENDMILEVLKPVEDKLLEYENRGLAIRNFGVLIGKFLAYNNKECYDFSLKEFLEFLEKEFKPASASESTPSSEGTTTESSPQSG